MPAGAGEVVLTTLFADVHYLFHDPHPGRPQYHRFVRGSYVYIYHHAQRHQAKLEIANHAGTPDQDALSGYLHSTSISYSYNQPVLCTLFVDAHVPDEKQWRLSGYDERGEHHFMQKLHSVDIYLWTEKDAATFLGNLKAVMPSSRVDIRDAPSASQTPGEHRDSMSPVVQQLEKTAIGTQFPPRTESALSTSSIPGPATPATTATASSSAPISPPQTQPIAYNPAAPAAPEPIAHREKTPPPPDGSQGTGLMNAAAYQGLPQPQYPMAHSGYANGSNQPTPQNAYFPGPPQPSQLVPVQDTYTVGVPPPPPNGPSPQPGLQQQPQYAQHFTPTPPNQYAQPISPPPQVQSFGGPPGQTQYATYAYAHPPVASPSFGPYAAASPGIPGTPSYQPMQPPTPSAPPAYAGHTPVQSPGLPPPPPMQPSSSRKQPAAHEQAAMIAGYSNYSYAAGAQPGAAQQVNQYGAYTGDIHNQLYRPTAEEQSQGHHSYYQAPKPHAVRQDSASGKAMKKVEDKITTTEGKVSKFLKGLDRLI